MAADRYCPDAWSEGPHARLAELWGHHAPDVLSLCVVAAVVIGLRPPPAALAVTLPLALASIVLTSWVMLRRHERHLCERCLAALPLDASERAERYGRRLQLAHAGAQPAAVIAYLAVLIGTNFIPGPVGRVSWVLAQSTLIYVIRSHVTHRQLQPWCRWCREDGPGDDRRDAPTPPPSDDEHLLV